MAAKQIRVNGSFVDDKKVSDHHAIIPTEQFVQLDHMSSEERKIYDMVVRRFLSVLCPPFEYEQVTMEAEAAGHRFLAKGKIVKNQAGRWPMNKSLRRKQKTKRFEIRFYRPEKFGEELSVDRIEFTSGKTKPPARFNEASLLAAMENPVRFMQTKDAQAVKTLGETGGLGTVATRADIIEKLFHSFLMEKRGQEIYLTSKARQLLELVPEDLKKPELTADWEMKLSHIAKGKMKKKSF